MYCEENDAIWENSVIKSIAVMSVSPEDVLVDYLKLKKENHFLLIITTMPKMNLVKNCPVKTGTFFKYSVDTTF